MLSVQKALDHLYKNEGCSHCGFCLSLNIHNMYLLCVYIYIYIKHRCTAESVHCQYSGKLEFVSLVFVWGDLPAWPNARVLKTFVTQIQKYHPLMTALSEHKGGEEATSDSWNNEK